MRREQVKKEEKTLVAIWILSLFMAIGIAPLASAGNQAITCQTNFGEKSFTIEANTVAFHQKKHDGRSISSVLASKTRKSPKGFRKTIYQDGYKHLINIENQKNFNSDNDFLAVTSPKGHKMTFPINCSLLD